MVMELCSWAVRGWELVIKWRGPLGKEGHMCTDAGRWAGEVLRASCVGSVLLWLLHFSQWDGKPSHQLKARKQKEVLKVWEGKRRKEIIMKRAGQQMDWEDVVGPPSRPRLPFASKGASQRGRPFSRHSQSHRLGPEVGGEKGWSSVGVWSSKRDNRNEDVFQGVLTGLTTGFKLGQEKGQGVKGLRDVKAWKNRVQGNLRDWADHLWEISLRVGCLSLRLWSCWVMTWFKLRQWERISLTGWKTRSISVDQILVLSNSRGIPGQGQHSLIWCLEAMVLLSLSCLQFSVWLFYFHFHFRSFSECSISEKQEEDGSSAEVLFWIDFFKELQNSNKCLALVLPHGNQSQDKCLFLQWKIISKPVCEQ